MRPGSDPKLLSGLAELDGKIQTLEAEIAELKLYVARMNRQLEALSRAMRNDHEGLLLSYGCAGEA